MATLGNSLVAKSSLKVAKNYYCEKCDYTCSKIYNWKKHLDTAKHCQETDSVAKNGKKEETYLCEKCDKCFHTNSGLWKHNKICNQNINNNTVVELPNDELIQEKNKLIQDKNELIQYLINENKEFKNLILEIVKKDNSNNITNNINTNNSHNKTFNLQFFLNETCKDAMNMSDFINSLTLQLSDLESVGKLGFVDGISNIIIKNLEALDVEKRPVHCCDSKRETMYIKDQDKWEKDDNEMKRMKELVRYVRDKNISMVNVWRDLYPECVTSNSKKTTQFNQIYMESFGGEKGTKKEKEEKIISRIAKAVIIDKNE